MKHKHIYDATFQYTPADKQQADHLQEKFKKIRADIEAEKKRVAERDAKVCGEIKPRVKAKS